jgi:hypothetical protein
MKKRHFEHGPVSSLEDRALLSGGSGFPADQGRGDAHGFRGALVLTSRAYENVRGQISGLILNFIRIAVSLYARQGGFTQDFDDKIGVCGYGAEGQDSLYAKGTLLARFDARIPC